MDKLRQGFSRTKQKVLQRMGKAEKTVDPEFEQARKEFQALDQSVSNLNKFIKAYTDSVRGLSHVQKQISDYLSGPKGFYDAHSALNASAIAFGQAQQLMEEASKVAYDSLIADVVTPLGGFVALFPEIKKRVSRRDKLLLDYDAARHQLDRLIEKPSTDPTKLPATEHRLAAAGDVYMEYNQQLMDDIADIQERKFLYLDYPFIHLMQSQFQYLADSYSAVDTYSAYKDAYVEPPPVPLGAPDASNGNAAPEAPAPRVARDPVRDSLASRTSGRMSGTVEAPSPSAPVASGPPDKPPPRAAGPPGRSLPPPPDGDINATTPIQPIQPIQPLGLKGSLEQRMVTAVEQNPQLQRQIATGVVTGVTGNAALGQAVGENEAASRAVARGTVAAATDSRVQQAAWTGVKAGARAGAAGAAK